MGETTTHSFHDDGSTSVVSFGHDVDSSRGTNKDVPNHRETENKISIANEESRHVDWMRYVLFFVLLVTAVVVSVLAFYAARRGEEEDFEQAFGDLAQKLIDTFEANSKRRLAAVESMAVAITSSAIAEGQTWPNVTLPDWERRATYTMDLSDLMSLFFCVIVTGENRRGWDAYATEHQGWIAEGLRLQGDIAEGQQDEQESIELLETTWGPSPNKTIPEQMIMLTGTGVEVSTGEGPFAPLWMMAPTIPVRNVINYDTLSHPTRRLAVKSIIENSVNLVTEAWDYSDTSNPTTIGKKAALNLFINRRPGTRQSYQDGPVSDLYVPIFDTHEPSLWSSQPQNRNFTRNVVGYLTGYVYWQAFLIGTLPPNSKEVIVVLSNSCGQHFTYSVQGQRATYVGPGDLHDTKYDRLEVTTEFGAFLDMDIIERERVVKLGEGQCVYKMQVFPSHELEVQYITWDPWIITGVLLCTFLLTSGAFVLYDFLVQRRQEIVMKQAVKSTQVLHSLFPAPVRDRMGSGHMKVHATDSDAFTEDASLRDPNGIIADLYPSATVLFADLAGFTAWSASREPKQVFLLLENLYGAFDTIAKRRMVFKIETIGDCYLAVTGVPRPQEKHALIMARFATECMAKMDILIETKLVDLLGAETANLKLRVGLHSGAVTAGVLRGERARYQLFGDTVNTASRMESNSMAGMIQCSESTAKFLKKAGKSGWLSEREGGIEAKGKGRMRTWWVQATTSGKKALGDGTFERLPQATPDTDMGTGDNKEEQPFEAIVWV